MAKDKRGSRRNKPGASVPHPPPPNVLKRLQVYERTPSGGARNYIDPVTHKVYSWRQRETARKGMSLEQAKVIRDQGASIEREAKRAQRRHERIPFLVKQFQDRETAETGKRRSQSEILSDPVFWKHIRALNRSEQNIRAKVRALVAFGMVPPGDAQAVLARYTTRMAR